MKICFVCTGNTCRSVMAERLMKKELKKRGIRDIKVSSKGLNATGENIAENAKLALKKFGASGTNRKSVKLKKIDPKTIYVTMTDLQKSKIDSKQVISFGQLVGQVPDPYGQDLNVYIQTCEYLQQGVIVLIDKILKMRGLV